MAVGLRECLPETSGNHGLYMFIHGIYVYIMLIAFMTNVPAGFPFMNLWEHGPTTRANMLDHLVLRKNPKCPEQPQAILSCTTSRVPLGQTGWDFRQTWTTSHHVPSQAVHVWCRVFCFFCKGFSFVQRAAIRCV